MDLEEEFQKLVQGMFQQIATKEANGDLTRYQAQDLRDMIDDRVKSNRPAWNSSGCSIGSDYEDDDGWRGSSYNC